MDRRRRSLRSPLDTDAMAKVTRRREKPRERWLLTRKTWKYMADAGRRLIPDGAQNRIEDVPHIEAYFQEVCGKEPHFLLWRKGSYPGALPRPRRKKRPRGGSVHARSPCDDASPAPARPTDLLITHVSGGRFDIAKLRRDFFAVPPASPKLAGSSKKQAAGPSFVDALGGSSSDIRCAGFQAGPCDSAAAAQAEDGDLAVLLRKYLKIQDEHPITSRISETEELLNALRKYLTRQATRDEMRRSPRDADGDNTARTTLADALGRYYGRSSDRDHILQDLVTDRDLLKKLYQDLRKTKPYKGGRGRDVGDGSGGGPAFAAGAYGGAFRGVSRRSATSASVFSFDKDIDFGRSPPLSPPPLIEVQSEESLEEKKMNNAGTQTDPVADEVLTELERAYREKLEAATAPTSPTSPPPVERRVARRRSSVDHDDVSQSVSDTIKRYLRMARKKSVDADKADRFKRINYDKNLRNIKPRPPSEVDDDGPHKGCQTDEGWVAGYREALAVSVSPPTSPPSPVSPVSPSQSQSLLATLLGRGATMSPPAPAGGMQKSRSSSSVVQSVSKRLWRTRSRSSSRVAASWTPQGSCVWADSAGRCVRLTDCSLLALAEVERRALQQAALARLQQLNLGINVKIPEENSSAVSSKPKRRTYLLKRKALTTGFFDQTRGKDEKEGSGGVPAGAGGVFGVPLSQCVESERALRRRRLTGSRASLASLAADRADDSESCDSGEWGGSWAGVEDSGPKVPALVSACLAHLRRHGLNTLGLFRVSASKKRVRQLREEWERGQEAALDGAACPHDVATLLKEFLRDLPDPLLCRDLYAAFLQTQKIRSRRLQWEAMRLVVQLLPVAHRDTLSALLAFLAQLAMHAPDALQPGNKMDAANLATVFAPNILHRNKPNEPASAEQLSERADVINVVRLLIERQAELWTLPAEMLHEAYIHLAHTAPAHLDSLLQRRAECANERLGTSVGSVTAAVASEEAEHERRVWSREEFLHGGAATGGPDRDVPVRRSEKIYGRSRRTRDTASDTSSGSLSSAMTIVTRVRSSTEECGSSGVMCSAPSATPSARTDSAPDSADSASDYNETLGGSDDDSCIITASLHIPAAFPREAPRPRRQAQPPPRRRSTSGSESSAKRDSAVGSSSPASASNTSSPPASPPPAHAHAAVGGGPLRVTVTSTGELKRPSDIDRLISLGRERNTSDARAVVVRQQDESTSPRRPERSRRDAHPAAPAASPAASSVVTVTASATTTTSSSTLYKRGELISSARTPAPPP